MSEPATYGSPEPGAPPDPDAVARQLAIRRVKAKRGFRTHLFTYTVVNGAIFVVWLAIAIGAGGANWFPWFVFSLFGWGIGLAFHWRAAYGQPSRPIDEAEIEAEIEAEMRRRRGR